MRSNLKTGTRDLQPTGQVRDMWEVAARNTNKVLFHVQFHYTATATLPTIIAVGPTHRPTRPTPTAIALIHIIAVEPQQNHSFFCRLDLPGRVLYNIAISRRVTFFVMLWLMVLLCSGDLLIKAAMCKCCLVSTVHRRFVIADRGMIVFARGTSHLSYIQRRLYRMHGNFINPTKKLSSIAEL